MKIKKILSYNLILPLYDLAKGTRIRKSYKQLKEFSYWDPLDIKKLQEKKLQELIHHAYETVPFYSMRFDQLNLMPHNFKTIDDLKKLPPLRRVDIQKSFSQLISTKADLSKCYKGSSSGSTGQPVSYVRDKKGSTEGKAAIYFGWSMAGWEFGTPYLTLWGNPTCVNEDWQKLSSKIKSWWFSEKKIASFELTDKKHFKKCADLIIDRKLEFIQGYANAIYLLAYYMAENQIKVKHVKGVLTTAENLLPYQRNVIEDVLGPVYDFYGCGEINSVAFQCKTREGYHLMDTHVIVEYGRVVDDIGNRELLITDLDNYAMPMIRYANGDMGLPEEEQSCKCGLPFSKLTQLSGRISDIIKTPSGGSFTVPSFLGSRLLTKLTGLIRYQVELIEPLKLRIKLHVDETYSKDQELIINKNLEEYIPKQFQWKISYCDEIKSEANGKYKLFIDRTKDDFMTKAEKISLKKNIGAF